MKEYKNMEDKNFKKGIEQLKKISMTGDEKSKILDAVLSTPIAEKPVPSYFQFHFYKRRFVYYGAVVCLIIVFGSREMVFASENSLPGDILYPFKINVVEPISGALKIKAEKKAEYEGKLATKRLVEAETLAKENKLDEKKQKKINLLLEEHTKKLEKELKKLDDENAHEKADDIVVNFRADMNAHAQVLDIIDKDIEKNEDKDSRISDKARASTIRVRRNDDNKPSFKDDNYKKRKKSVEAIIESTSAEVNKNNKEGSPIKKKVFEDTNKTIDRARKFLDEADKEDEKSDKENAYRRLLESESSAKEADVFLRTGLKLNVE